MILSILDSVLILLAVAVVITTVFHQLRIPAIVGYIFIGVLVGPHLLGWISDTKTTKDLAEFGIVFLMFTIGLEFSLSHILSMKKAVFGYGGLQVTLSILLTTICGFLLGMSIAEAIIVGSIVAMSSTAIVMKQLTEQQELNMRHGIDSLGILLFQDLAVIPLLILIPSLANIDSFTLITSLSWATVKGVFAIGFIFVAGRWVLKPLFYKIAETHSLELFTLTALLVTLGAAWLTHQLGLSLALGAFMAGIMLSETEFRHQIETDIRPFRDVLLGFFFISIGMQFNVRILVENWYWILLLVAALVLFKPVLITALGSFFAQNKMTATRTAVILAHGGEFGFAILALALSYQLLPIAYSQVILGALLISMGIAPILIRFNHIVAKAIFPEEISIPTDQMQINVAKIAQGLQGHVIICGYGRVGQNIARFLEKAELPFIALDLDPSRVRNASLAGDPVCYADASHHEILESAGIKQAKTMVISFQDNHAAMKILEKVRRINKNLPVVIRTLDDSESEKFYQKGATEIIPETLEASLILASHILLLMQVPNKKVTNLIDRSRKNRYDLLHLVVQGEETLTLEELDTIKEGLHPITLQEKAFAVGKQLKTLPLEELEVRATAVRRGAKRYTREITEMELLPNDIVVLHGDFANLTKAEKLLLEGKS